MTMQVGKFETRIVETLRVLNAKETRVEFRIGIRWEKGSGF